MVSSATTFTLPSSASSSRLSLSTLLIRSASNHYPISSKSNFIHFCRNPLSLRPKSVAGLFFNQVLNASIDRHSIDTSSSSKPFFRPVMEWQDCTVKMEVDVPASVAYNCYADREAMPQWMPFISSVKVLEDKPDESRWTLKYKAFGRDIEFSWLARNLQPIPNQKIHWRSLEGLPNRGAVRFYPKGPASCLIELTVSYEVPQLLAPVASALQPFMENLLLRCLDGFSNYAKTRQ